MSQKSGAAAQWLDEAVKGIRFGPDRAAVRAELEAHLEDKAADLQRIFPDMLPEDAEARALEDMGDPAEIGKALARIHKPWLGYLWRASKWIAILLVVLLMAANILNNDHYQSAGYPLWGAFSTVRGPQEGEKTELEGYTFQIVGAAYLDSVSYTHLSYFGSFVDFSIRLHGNVTRLHFRQSMVWGNSGNGSRVKTLVVSSPGGPSSTLSAGPRKKSNSCCVQKG